MQRTATQVLNDALIEYEKKKRLDVKNFAKKIGLSYSTVYHPVREKTRCLADNWLLILEELGAVEYRKNGIFIKHGKKSA